MTAKHQVAPDAFRLSPDEISELEAIQVLGGFPTLRAALAHTIETEFRSIIFPQNPKFSP